MLLEHDVVKPLYDVIKFKEEIAKQIEILREKIRVNNEKQRVFISLLQINTNNKHLKDVPLFFDQKGKKPFIGNCGMKDQVFHPVQTSYMRHYIKDTQKWTLNMHAKDKQPWTKEKDKKLLNLKENGFNWDEIGKSLDKINAQCALRYCKLKEMEVPPVKWNSEMDQALIDLIEQFGEKEMYLITKKFNEKKKGFGLTCAQVSYRYRYMLRPDIKHGPWKPEEDAVLIMALRLLAVKDKRKFQFQEIQKLMKNTRTDAQIRDRMKILATYNPNLPYFRTKTPNKKRKRQNIAKKKVKTEIKEESKAGAKRLKKTFNSSVIPRKKRKFNIKNEDMS